MTARPRQGIAQGAVVEAAQVRRRQTEAEFQKRVLELARLRGWIVHYLPDWMYRAAMLAMKQRRRGDRDWQDPGFVDLVLGRRDVVLVVECKSDDGSLAPEQRAWRAILEAAGLRYRLWRPIDLENGAIEKELE